MIATKDYYIPISEKEMVELMKQFIIIDVVFGTSSCALFWKKGQELPKSIEYLGLMRGVTNENLDGGGI